MRYLKFQLLVLALALLTSTPAFALKLSGVGVADWSTPKVIGSDYKALPSYGLGALLEFRVMPFVGFEIGALSVPRRFEYVKPNTENKVQYKMKMTQIPVQLKAYLGRSIAFGVGAYYAKFNETGSYDITIDGVTTSGTDTLASQNQSASDYGLVTSLALYFHIAPFTKFLIDARYTMGIKDNNPGVGTTHYNDVQALTGLQFGF
jgi:hypothetical protein